MYGQIASFTILNLLLQYAHIVLSEYENGIRLSPDPIFSYFLIIVWDGTSQKLELWHDTLKMVLQPLTPYCH